MEMPIWVWVVGGVIAVIVLGIIYSCCVAAGKADDDDWPLGI